MQHLILTLSTGNTAPSNYDRLPIFLFPLLAALAVLGTLLLAGFRASATAVFLHPLSERTVIAKSGKRFLVFPEKEPDDPDDPDESDGNDEPDQPGPDLPPDRGRPQVWVTDPTTTPDPAKGGRAKGRGGAAQTGERVRDH